MRRRKLVITLAAAALFGLLVVPASAELHRVTVTLVTGQTMTLTVDVPPGTAVYDDSTRGAAVALRQLWSVTYREAQTMTYADAFTAIAICFLIATATVPLMRKVAPPKGPSADAH